MSASQKVQLLKLQFDLFQGLNFPGFFRAPGSYQEWDGFNIQEFQQAIEYLKSIFNAAFEKNAFFNLPTNSLTPLINQLTNSVQQCQALLNNPGNQGLFQNAASGIDALMQQVMTYNVPFLVSGGTELEAARKAYENESNRLAELSANAEALNKSVKTLIEPAVSGSLSKSFSDRRRSLFAGRLVWGVLTVGTLFGGVYATAELITALLTAFPTKVGEAQQMASTIPLLALRSAILLPIYIALGFFFSQYRKERDLEEEYAHKAAVAATLPNYGDLAKDVAVKDQIVAGASNVIFTSPIRKMQEESDSLPIESVKGLLEAASKFVRRQ